MSNVIAGIVRGQIPHLAEHVQLKKAIYERYKEGFADLPVDMNPYIEGVMEPNFWLSCVTVRPEAMCHQERTDLQAGYEPEAKKSCPTEILEAIDSINAEGRPLWKPMHMQSIFAGCEFVTAKEAGVQIGDRRRTIGACPQFTSEDLFERGLCLPSDIKMTPGQQERVIEVVRACFE